MHRLSLETLRTQSDALSLYFKGEISLKNIAVLQREIELIDFSCEKKVSLDFKEVTFFDTAAALFIYEFQKKLLFNNIQIEIAASKKSVLEMLSLVEKYKEKEIQKNRVKIGFLEKIGKSTYKKYCVFLSFAAFLGELFAQKIHLFTSLKEIRYKEIFFEINESGVKALGIVMLTTFLIGLVVAYQSAYQLKIYGANIFIVDMLGISLLRELAPLVTAIVVAGRSGSAFTAQLGAMKITQELDAMKTMGFEPYKFLVLPKIFALIVVLPILIFVADIVGLLGGMIIAWIDLGISSNLFLERFKEVIAAKHFFLGILKGPFFGFLIGAISIFRGLYVKNDTQSIGVNTTRSVVESIFAVIFCDAFFSIIFTKMGI